MCGVYGWHFTAPPSLKTKTLLSLALASMNDGRGGDSWGYATPDGTVVKGLGQLARNLAARDIAQHDIMIAHCRFRTDGAVTKDNSHPYKFGDIIGAHNGCIYNRTEFDKFPNRTGFAVDSMHLIKHIEEARWPMDDMDGYGTVEYFDLRDPNAVFLSRFANGELAVARLKKHGWVWSSDTDHLRIALALADIPASLVETKETRVYRIDGEGKWTKTDNRILVNGGKVGRIGYSKYVSTCEPPAPTDTEGEEKNDEATVPTAFQRPPKRTYVIGRADQNCQACEAMSQKAANNLRCKVCALCTGCCLTTAESLMLHDMTDGIGICMKCSVVVFEEELCEEDMRCYDCCECEGTDEDEEEKAAAEGKDDDETTPDVVDMIQNAPSTETVH